MRGTSCVGGGGGGGPGWRRAERGAAGPLAAPSPGLRLLSLRLVGCRVARCLLRSHLGSHAAPCSPSRPAAQRAVLSVRGAARVRCLPAPAASVSCLLGAPGGSRPQLGLPRGRRRRYSDPSRRRRPSRQTLGKTQEATGGAEDLGNLPFHPRWTASLREPGALAAWMRRSFPNWCPGSLFMTSVCGAVILKNGGEGEPGLVLDPRSSSALRPGPPPGRPPY